MYVQLFFLITFFENRKKITIRKEAIKLNTYPDVTIIVPCFNEEKTVGQTVDSLLNLNYPKDKMQIFLVDDGSTDSTWKIIQRFIQYPNIKVFHKENGGKYTALNLGLGHVETPYLGCLDADSMADKEALIRIMSYFEKDSTAMAVAPAVIVHNPKNIIENAQKVEYAMGVYFKKMLGFLGAINVTPGPFTIFKKKVFDDLGSYRYAHNTEDMEIAYRMQKNHYKIENCNDAYIYTNAPRTLKKLYKQRLRWIYGFINNTIDYRNILFRKKYGNFSTFTVPAGIVSIFSVSYLFGRIIYNFGNFLYFKIVQFKALGFHFVVQASSFDLFFINTQSLVFIILTMYSLVIFSMMLGHRMTEGKWGLSLNMIYFFSIFSIIAPFWLMKAIYNTILSKKPSWR